jgi:hypothetical protein
MHRILLLSGGGRGKGEADAGIWTGGVAGGRDVNTGECKIIHIERMIVFLWDAGGFRDSIICARRDHVSLLISSEIGLGVQEFRVWDLRIRVYAL